MQEEVGEVRGACPDLQRKPVGHACCSCHQKGGAWRRLPSAIALRACTTFMSQPMPPACHASQTLLMPGAALCGQALPRHSTQQQW